MEYREGESRFAEGDEWNVKLGLSSRDRISEFALIPSGRLTIVRATWAGAICIAGCHVASWLAPTATMLLDSRQYLLCVWKTRERRDTNAEILNIAKYTQAKSRMKKERLFLR